MRHYRDSLLAFGADASPSQSARVRWAKCAGQFIRGKRFTKADYEAAGIAVHPLWRDLHTLRDLREIGRVAPATRHRCGPSVSPRPGDVVIVDVGETVEDVGKAVAWLGDERRGDSRRQLCVPTRARTRRSSHTSCRRVGFARRRRSTSREPRSSALLVAGVRQDRRSLCRRMTEQERIVADPRQVRRARERPVDRACPPRSPPAASSTSTTGTCCSPSRKQRDRVPRAWRGGQRHPLRADLGQRREHGRRGVRA